MATWPGAGALRSYQEQQREWVQANDACRRQILQRLVDAGPLPSRELPDRCEVPWQSTGWTNDRNITVLLNFMVQRGEVAVAGRAGNERLWDLADRVYPDEYDVLVATTGITAGYRVLEVGSASGKATVPLTRRGFALTGIEIGRQLAAIARQVLADFPEVTIVEGDFETWDPRGVMFDLVFAATAWHWIDPAIGYQRAWEALRPGGHLAFWSATHVSPEDGDQFFVEIQEIYDAIGESLPEGATRPRPGELLDHRAEIERSGLFDGVVVRHLDWQVSYDAEG